MGDSGGGKRKHDDDGIGRHWGPYAKCSRRLEALRIADDGGGAEQQGAEDADGKGRQNPVPDVLVASCNGSGASIPLVADDGGGAGQQGAEDADGKGGQNPVPDVLVAACNGSGASIPSVADGVIGVQPQPEAEGGGGEGYLGVVLETVDLVSCVGQPAAAMGGSGDNAGAAPSLNVLVAVRTAGETPVVQQVYAERRGRWRKKRQRGQATPLPGAQAWATGGSGSDPPQPRAVADAARCPECHGNGNPSSSCTPTYSTADAGRCGAGQQRRPGAEGGGGEGHHGPLLDSSDDIFQSAAGTGEASGLVAASSFLSAAAAADAKARLRVGNSRWDEMHGAPDAAGEDGFQAQAAQLAPRPWREGSVARVTVPGWLNVPPLFREGILLFLFGPVDNISVAEFLSIAANHPGELAPPRNMHTAYLHVDGHYATFLADHFHGLAGQVHGFYTRRDVEERPVLATYDYDETNSGTIRFATGRILARPAENLTERRCDECKSPADLVGSCCGAKVCKFCFRKWEYHLRPDRGTVCRGRGAVGPLPHALTRLENLSRLDEGLVCSSHLLTTVVESVSGRPKYREVFLFQVMESLQNLG
ncbi:hypothetical protein ACP4OV_003145 [Aristida adscensionis]